MNKWKVESEFEHEGLKCVVLMTNIGHRCGYVGVSEAHPLFGKDYDDLPDDINVHGGVTYAGGEGGYPIPDGLWWFGFDCAHYGDANDYEQAFKYGLVDKNTYSVMNGIYNKINTYGVVRSLNYCTEECKRLAVQLSKQ